MAASNSDRQLLRRIAVGLALLLLPLVAFAVLATPRGPRLVAPPRQLDLGEGRPGKTLRHVLSLRNVGAAPCEFSIDATCGCTRLSPRQGTIPPGRAQDIEIAVALPNHVGSEKTVRLTIETNESGGHSYNCTVAGRCFSPLVVRPSIADFGCVQDGQAGVVRLTVSRPDGSPLHERQLQVRVPSERLRVFKEAAGDGAVALKLELAAQSPAVDLYDSLELLLDGSPENEVVPVPVCARSVTAVSISPSTVILRRDSGTGTWREELLFVVNHHLDNPLGPLKVVAAPPGLRVVDDGTFASGARRRLRMTVVDGAAWEGQSSNSDVSLAFDGLQERLSVKVIKRLE